MISKLTVKDVELKNRTVLMRVDFNVPIKNGKVADDTRITCALPTIKYVVENGGIPIILSHLGRPKGKPDPEYSLKPVQIHLQKLYPEVNVIFAEDCVGEKVKEAVKNLKENDILLLENTRFHKEEKSNDPEFSKKLADIGCIHINDAFGTAHRAHASNVGVAKYLKSAAGFLMEKEIEYLGEALSDPKKPFAVILGGAKVSDKIGVIENLLNKADKILIGGGMMFTFLKAKGYEVGNSLLEEDKIELASQLMKKAKEKNVEIVLPVDAVCASEIDENAETVTVSVQEIPADLKGLDIGPETCELFSEKLKDAKTVVWNGPMGVFEIDKFSKGTLEIAKTLSELDAVTIVGGGDSAAAVNKLGYGNQISHISTGGGASLEMLEGKILPGIESITDK